MICPLQQAFPEVNKNITDSYTNVHNTKYSLVEDFTPDVYGIETDAVFNSVKGNYAIMNNYSNDSPSTYYYKYITYDDIENGNSNKKTCMTGPKCKELLYVEEFAKKTNNSVLIKDQGDALMLLGLTAFFYYILN
jgi:hypothetical protein